jgi:hypothetical protein
LIASGSQQAKIHGEVAKSNQKFNPMIIKIRSRSKKNAGRFEYGAALCWYINTSHMVQ